MARASSEVVEARRALLSVSAIIDAGWCVAFNQQRPVIKLEGVILPLHRRGGLYSLEGAVLDAGQAASADKR